MISNFTGIILSGGKSSRMGEDKAFKLFSGRPLIEIVIEKMSSLFEDLLIVTNSPHLYKEYSIRTVSDVVKDCGPLGGIYTGLLSSPKNNNFIVACDMPFLNENLVKFMAKQHEEYDVIIPQFKGLFEPLCAVYSKNCIKPIEKALSNRNFKMIDFLGDVKVRVINEKEISDFDKEALSFININTPLDCEDNQTKIQRKSVGV
tara:strand:- start:1 stop:609 length:609 start_codon:yes stop_codon:yes gene_type:complete